MYSIFPRIVFLSWKIFSSNNARNYEKVKYLYINGRLCGHNYFNGRQICASTEPVTFNDASFPAVINSDFYARRLKYLVYPRGNYFIRYFSTAVEQLANGKEVTSSHPSGTGKIYTEFENDEFRAYLENNPNYSETIYNDSKFPLEEVEVTEEEFNDIVDLKNWVGESSDVYFISFMKVATYCRKIGKPISDPLLTNVCAAFPSKSQHFSHDQLVKCFMCLHKWPEAPGVLENNFLIVWKSLDAICLLRRGTWGFKRTLFMVDLWYSLKLTRLSAFVMKSVSKLIDKRSLTQYEVVQLSFYLNAIRKVPHRTSVFDFIFNLSNMIEALTIEEVAIVCAGLFKSQTKVPLDDMINKIIFKAIENKDDIHPFYLASIFKLLRYTYRKTHIENITKLLDNFTPLMSKYSLQVNLHFGLLCWPKLISHPPAINQLMEIFLSSPAEARVKDIEKVAQMLSLFRSVINKSNVIMEVILNEIEKENRETEFNKFTRSFIRCLCYLSYEKCYSEKLISRILSEDLLKDVFRNNYETDKEVVILDQNVSLEFQEYKGKTLSPDFVNYLCKRHSLNIPGTLENKRIAPGVKYLHHIMLAVRTLSGDRDNLWHCTYFLPHFPRADVLLHVDKNNQLLSIPQEIKQRKEYTGPIKPPATSGRWLLFVAGNYSHFTTDYQLVGETVCKLRQLKLLGYSPVLIPYFEMDLLPQTTEAIVDYIKGKIRKSSQTTQEY